MHHGQIIQNASVYASSHGMRISEQATKDTLKVECRSHFRYKCWTLNILLLHNSLDYLTFTRWSMKTTKSWHNWPINRDPTNGDRSLQLFLLHILPLCNVWQHLDTCASQVMGVYASHAIALNKSGPKLLAHVSLNANCFMFTSGCLLLFTFSYTFMAQKFYFTILQWTQKTLFMHCANMSYIYHCLLLSTEGSNIKKVCARSLLVKICLQAKMNLFSSDVIVTSV